MPSLRRPSRRQKLPSRIDVLKAYGSYAFHNALTWLRRVPAEGFSRRVPLTKGNTGGFEYAALVSTQQPSLLVFESRGGKPCATGTTKNKRRQANGIAHHRT